MASISVQVDPTDVATVRALEPKLRAAVEALRDAEVAIKRLADADYPGAGHVRDMRTFEYSPELVLRAVEEFRIGDGDQAALDYHRLVRVQGLPIPAAVAAIIDGDRDMARVDAFRLYALKLQS